MYYVWASFWLPFENTSDLLLLNTWNAIFFQIIFLRINHCGYVGINWKESFKLNFAWNRENGNTNILYHRLCHRLRSLWCKNRFYHFSWTKFLQSYFVFCSKFCSRRFFVSPVSFLDIMSRKFKSRKTEMFYHRY